MSTVLAHPPSACCLKFVKHEGTPVGTMIDLGGMKTYVSEPKTPSKKVIIYFSDIHSPNFVNNQLLMDFYASHGFTVLAPDYFFGDSVLAHTEANARPDFVLQDWLDIVYPRAQKAVPAWLEAVFAKYGTTDTKYNVVGFCFGASFTTALAATDKIAAAAIAHPAFLTEDNIKHIKRPIFFLCAETDMTFPLESRRFTEDILRDQREHKAPYHLSIYGGVEHGFAIRADLSDENIRWSKEDAARRVIDWFNRFSEPTA